jgi:hypothetical protein
LRASALESVDPAASSPVPCANAGRMGARSVMALSVRAQALLRGVISILG